MPSVGGWGPSSHQAELGSRALNLSSKQWGLGAHQAEKGGGASGPPGRGWGFVCCWAGPSGVALG